MSVKNAIGILVEIALSLQTAWGNMDILTLSSLTIYKDEMSLDLFISSFISVIEFLYFSLFRSFTSLF